MGGSEFRIDREPPIPSSPPQGVRVRAMGQTASRAPSSPQVCCSVLVAAAAATWIVSLGPPPLGEDLDYSTLVRRPRRAPAAPLHHPRRPLAPAGDRAGRRSALPQAAVRLRGPALPDPSRRRSAGAGPRRSASSLHNGHIVSGGSTLTMQVARLLEPRTRPHACTAKLRQMVRAIEIEHALSKDQILALYLSLAPYGGNLEGIRAASLAYFGKEPRRLTLGEAALLVALPQSPEAPAARSRAGGARSGARPRARPHGRRRPRAAPTRSRAPSARPVPTGRKPMPMLAPHAADAAVAAAPGAQLHQLTIDADAAEDSRGSGARARPRARRRKFRSPSWRSTMRPARCWPASAPPIISTTRRAGQVDMTQALRSPGST